MTDVDTVEAVWNQAHGVVQLFVNDALLMAMPQAQARDMANGLLAAARAPDLARAMLDGGPAVIPGSDADNGFRRWSPDASRDAVLREQYAR